MSLAGIFTAWSIKAATADSGSRPATFGAPGEPVAAPGGSVLAAAFSVPRPAVPAVFRPEWATGPVVLMT